MGKAWRKNTSRNISRKKEEMRGYETTKHTVTMLLSHPPCKPVLTSTGELVDTSTYISHSSGLTLYFVELFTVLTFSLVRGGLRYPELTQFLRSAASFVFY